MGIALQRFDDALWPALQDAIHRHWRADHPLLDRPLFDWLYRGYGIAADGDPCAFVALDGTDVAGFLGLIPGMVRHVKAGGPQIRPQAFIALWFVAGEHRAGATGVLLLRRAQQAFDVVGSLGVAARATMLMQRLGYSRIEALTRWVVPLDPAYAELLRRPDPAVPLWLERVRRGAAAQPIAIDVAELAALAHRPDEVRTSGLERSADFYRWRYAESVGLRYQALASPDGGRAIVRVEQPARDGARPVLRIIELLPLHDALQLLGAVLGWGAEHGCCAADFQISRGDPLTDALHGAGFAARDARRPETLLAEVLRPYRPDADPINVVFRPDDDDLPDWRFLKSDGDMDRYNEPHSG